MEELIKMREATINIFEKHYDENEHVVKIKIKEGME